MAKAAAVDVAVSGVVRLATGAASPVLATTMTSAVVLGAASNTVQYAAAQKLKGEEITTSGVLLSVASGAIGGRIGGPVSKLNPSLSYDTAARGLSARLNGVLYRSQNITK